MAARTHLFIDTNLQTHFVQNLIHVGQHFVTVSHELHLHRLALEVPQAQIILDELGVALLACRQDHTCQDKQLSKQ